MKVIYVAGKYRDTRGEYYVRENIRFAEDYALKIWEMGGVAICPHKNTEGFGGFLPDSRWLDGDMELISRCDAMYLLSNYTTSSGTQQELNFAQNHNIPVLINLLELERFLDGNG